MARVSGLEDPLTSCESTTPHTGCREEETSNSPDMVDKPLTRVLIQRRSAVGVSSVSAQRFAGCRVLSSLTSSDLGTVRRLELCREEVGNGCWDAGGGGVVCGRGSRTKCPVHGIHCRRAAMTVSRGGNERPARYWRRSRNIVQDSRRAGQTNTTAVSHTR
jgi:hypothetical protein